MIHPVNKPVDPISIFSPKSSPNILIGASLMTLAEHFKTMREKEKEERAAYKTSLDS
jgi:hypothetical protein